MGQKNKQNLLPYVYIYFWTQTLYRTYLYAEAQENQALNFDPAFTTLCSRWLAPKDTWTQLVKIFKKVQFPLFYLVNEEIQHELKRENWKYIALMLFWIFPNLNISSLYSFPLFSASSPPLLCSSIKVSGCQQKVWRALQNQKKNSKKEEEEKKNTKAEKYLGFSIEATPHLFLL